MRTFLLSALALVYASISIGQLTNGLVCHYKFDGNTLDSSPNNHNSSSFFSNYFANDRNNNPNGAMYFDTISTNGNGAYTNINGLSDSHVSVSMWYKNSSNTLNSSPNTIINSQSTISSLYSWSIESTKTSSNTFNISFYVYQSNFAVYSQVHLVDLDTNWHHLGFTFQENDSIHIYLDGIKSVSTWVTFSGGLADVPNRLNLSAPNDTYCNKSSLYDELRIYNRKLSDSEMMSLFTGATSGIDEYSENNLFSLYPNPASNVINIKSTNKINKIEIQNLNGQIVKTLKPTNNSIDISDIARGIYIVQVYNSNGDIVNQKKLIKQ